MKTQTPLGIAARFFTIAVAGLIVTLVYINDPVEVKQRTAIAFILASIAYLLYEITMAIVSSKKKNLSQREQHLYDAIMSARDVQDFLWGEGLTKIEPERLKDVCIGMYQKRIEKLKEIDFTNKSARVELRKRILQNAAISIKMLEQIN